MFSGIIIITSVKNIIIITYKIIIIIITKMIWFYGF